MSDAKNTLDLLVSRVEQLPSLPAIVHQLVAVTDNPDATIEMVEAVIRADQSLAAKILKMVNSAFFALSSRVSTISHAVVILGFDAVRNTALTVCTYDYLAQCGLDTQFDKRRFWEHATAVGIFSKQLSATVRYKKTDEAFVAGLLHDLGKLVLDEYFASGFAQALERCRTTGVPLEVCEKEVLGFDHCYAGAAVARKWRFPIQLVDAIEEHHAPAATNVLCACVKLADMMARAWRQGASGNRLLSPVDPTVWDHLPVSEADLREIIEESRDEIIQVNRLFNSDETGQQDEPRAEQDEPCAEQDEPVTEPEVDNRRAALFTTIEAPLIPLHVYLETSRFDVKLIRPGQPLKDGEVECLVVWETNKDRAAKAMDNLLEKHPFLRSLPSVAVGDPCDPEAVVSTLRGPQPAVTAAG